MKNNIKPLRRHKREVVMPFQGEENFVVPKRGGFGQADNDKYVMVTGRTLGTPISTTAIRTVETTTPAPAPIVVASAPRVVAPAPTPTPTPIVVASAPRVIETPTRVVTTPTPTPIVEPQPTVISTPTRAVTPTSVDTRTAPAPNTSTLSTNTEQIGQGVGVAIPSVGTPRGGATMESTLSDIGITTTRPTVVENAPVPELPSRVDTTTPSRGGSGTTLPDDIITPPSGGDVIVNPRGGSGGDVVIPPKNEDVIVNPIGGSGGDVVIPPKNEDVIVNPPAEELPTFPDFNTLTCDGLNAEIVRISNIVSTTRFSSSTIANLYNDALANAKNVYTSKCNNSGGNQSSDVIPQFPDFSTLSCIDLTAQVSSISSTMANLKIGIEGQTPTVTQVVASAYLSALQSAKNSYNSKCVSSGGNTPDVSVKTETQLPSPIGGGIGGGGLGLGEEPTDETGAVAETPKTNYNWLIVLLLLGGGIYMLRKK